MSINFHFIVQGKRGIKKRILWNIIKLTQRSNNTRSLPVVYKFLRHTISHHQFSCLSLTNSVCSTLNLSDSSLGLRRQMIIHQCPYSQRNICPCSYEQNIPEHSQFTQLCIFYESLSYQELFVSHLHLRTTSRTKMNYQDPVQVVH